MPGSILNDVEGRVVAMLLLVATTIESEGLLEFAVALLHGWSTSREQYRRMPSEASGRTCLVVDRGRRYRLNMAVAA
jgi:hypothetical protein